MYEYRALVVKIVDGDTLDVDIDLGLTVWRRDERLRLFGIDTPDKNPKKAAATEFVKSLLVPGDEVVIRTYKPRKTEEKGKYGRYLATIIIPGQSMTLNDMLVEEGYALPYDGTGPRPDHGE